MIPKCEDCKKYRPIYLQTVRQRTYKILDIDQQHFKSQVGFIPTMQECPNIKEPTYMIYNN